ncbi:imm11 family protein [Pyxidicoccus sp. 3LFB2]
MHRRLFKLYDDVYAPDRWELKGPVDAEGREPDDVWQFTGGHPVKDPGPLWMKYDIPGRPLDYSHGGLDVPIVHTRVAEVLTRLAPQDVQLLPVQVEEQTDPYFILVVSRLVRCIDEKASRIQRWLPEDGVPEKVGQYSSVRDLHIDRSRVGDAQIFRLQDWEVVIIVTEELKEALERSQATGMTFTEVP